MCLSPAPRACRPWGFGVCGISGLQRVVREMIAGDDPAAKPCHGSRLPFGLWNLGPGSTVSIFEGQMKYLVCVALAAVSMYCRPATAQVEFESSWMSGGAFGVDMSADREARVFASIGSSQGTGSGVKIGDPDGFKLIKTFQSPSMEYYGVEMAPDGLSFFAACEAAGPGYGLQRRRISDGVVLWEIQNLDGEAELSVTNDGTLGVIACQTNVRVLDLIAGRVLYTVGSGWYLTAQIAEDGSFFVWSQRGSPEIHIVDTTSGLDLGIIVEGSFPFRRSSRYISVSDIDLSPDGTRVAVAIGSDNGLRQGFFAVIDRSTNKPVFTKPAFGSGLRVEFSPTGDKLLVFGGLSPLTPSRPRVLSAQAGEVLATCDAGWEWISSVVWSPGGDSVWLSGDMPGGPMDRVAKYNTVSGVLLSEGREHGFVGWRHGVVIRDGRVYSANQRIACRSLADGRLLWATTVPGAFLQGVALSPDGKTAASINGDRLYFFDTLDGHVIRKVVLTPDPRVIESGDIGDQAPGSPYMCIVGVDRAWIVDFEGREVAAKTLSFNNDYHFVGVTSPDGSRCFVSRMSASGAFIDELRTSDLSLIRTLPGNAGDLVISPDGSLVALLPWKNRANDVADLEIRRTSDWSLVFSERTRGYQEYWSATFSDDNKHLWVGFRQDYIGSLRRYRLADGHVEHLSDSECARLLADLDVDNDGRTAAYLRDDGNIVVGAIN